MNCNMDRDILNTYCCKRVRDYMEMEIWGKKICAPYFINEFEMEMLELMNSVGVPKELIIKTHEEFKKNGTNFGWFRGKATPEEIKKSITDLNKKMNYRLENANIPVIVEVMKFHGIGVDCSGFVYNVLQYAFEKNGNKDVLNSTLAWQDTKKDRNVYRAGAFTFAGNASVFVKPENLQSLDLLLKKNEVGKYSHVALVLKKNEDFHLCHTSFRTYPQQVNISKIKLNGTKPEFEFSPSMGESWEALYAAGKIEFRRLACFVDID